MRKGDCLTQQKPGKDQALRLFFNWLKWETRAHHKRQTRACRILWGFDAKCSCCNCACKENKKPELFVWHVLWHNTTFIKHGKHISCRVGKYSGLNLAEFTLCKHEAVPLRKYLVNTGVFTLSTLPNRRFYLAGRFETVVIISLNSECFLKPWLCLKTFIIWNTFKTEYNICPIILLSCGCMGEKEED